MKILLAYSSTTGNTERIAKYIAGLDAAIDLVKIEETLGVSEDYDLIILGGWIDKGTFDKKTLKYMEGIKQKKVAFFYTLSAYANSKHAYDCTHTIKALLEKNENEVLNFFHCQGPVSEGLKKMMYGFDKDHPHYPDPARIRKWALAENHPNEEDFEVAKSFLNYTLRMVK